MSRTQWIVVLVLGIIIGSLATYWFMDPQQTDHGNTTHIITPGPGPQPQGEVDPAVITAPAPMDSAAPAATPRYEFRDAAAKGLIRYEVSGDGNSSGGSLLVAVQRLVDDDIDIYIIPGTVFLPSSSDAQKMVAWGVMGAVVANNLPMQQVSSMYLTSTDPRVFVLEAYCLNFELDNPSKSVSFQPATLASSSGPQVDVRAAQIIYEGKRQGLSIEGTQSAIWADHEHKTKQEIQTKFTVSDQEIDKAFDMLKNLPPPKVN